METFTKHGRNCTVSVTRRVSGDVANDIVSPWSQWSYISIVLWWPMILVPHIIFIHTLVGGIHHSVFFSQKVNWDYEIPNWMEKQNQWSFQDPKLEVLPYIRPMRGPCKGISTDNMALYGTVPPYLWILRSPLINFMFQTANQYMSRLGMILSHH